MKILDKFINLNYRISVDAYSSLFGHCDKEEAEAFIQSPFAWIWLIIPIFGIVAFYGTVWAHNLNLRRRVLEKRRQELEIKTANHL